MFYAKLIAEKQISVPQSGKSEQKPAPPASATPKEEKNATKNEKAKPAKAEKPKKGGASSAVDDTVDVGRLDMRVGRIIHCEKHPDADALYLEKIYVGEAQPRNVISGLVKWVPLEQVFSVLLNCLLFSDAKPYGDRFMQLEAGQNARNRIAGNGHVCFDS